MTEFDGKPSLRVRFSAEKSGLKFINPADVAAEIFVSLDCRKFISRVVSSSIWRSFLPSALKTSMPLRKVPSQRFPRLSNARDDEKLSVGASFSVSPNCFSLLFLRRKIPLSEASHILFSATINCAFCLSFSLERFFKLLSNVKISPLALVIKS